MKKKLIALTLSLFFCVNHIAAQRPLILISIVENADDSDEIQRMKWIASEQLPQTITASGIFQAAERTQAIRRYRQGLMLTDDQIQELQSARYELVVDIFGGALDRAIVAQLTFFETGERISSAQSSVRSMDDLGQAISNVVEVLLRATPEVRAAEEARLERERQERLAQEQRERQERERQARLAQEQRERQERERQARLAQEQRERQERERQERLAQEQRERQERERQARLAQEQRERQERERQERLAREERERQERIVREQREAQIRARQPANRWYRPRHWAPEVGFWIGHNSFNVDVGLRFSQNHFRRNGFFSISNFDFPYISWDFLKLKFATYERWDGVFPNGFSEHQWSLQALTGIKIATQDFGANNGINFFSSLRLGLSYYEFTPWSQSTGWDDWQGHGGMGFAWEFDLGVNLRRFIVGLTFSSPSSSAVTTGGLRVGYNFGGSERRF